MSVHQPGAYNIEAWTGTRWRGGMNRSDRAAAISTASRWAAEDGCRHRVFDPAGTVIFDTELPAHPIVLPDGRVPCDCCDSLVHQAEAEGNFPAWQQMLCDHCATAYAEANPRVGA